MLVQARTHAISQCAESCHAILLARFHYAGLRDYTMAAAMVSRQDINALKAYVSAPGNFGQKQAESTVRLHVTHSNLKAEFIELRLDLHVSLSLSDISAKACLRCAA